MNQKNNLRYVKYIALALFLFALSANIKFTFDNQFNISTELALAQEESHWHHSQPYDVPCVLLWGRDANGDLEVILMGIETFCADEGDSECEEIACH